MATAAATKRKPKRNKGRKKYTKFRPRIRSRHPSHNVLRSRKGSNTRMELLPFRSVVRLGSSSDMKDTITNGGSRIECNKVKAIKTSSNKRNMKKAFSDAGVISPEWYNDYKEVRDNLDKVNFPIVAKALYGSRGRGNHLLESAEEFNEFIRSEEKPLNFIFEEYKNYAREYRLHITEEGCFYTCRKMLKRDTPENEKWYRNDNNCVWYLESNPDFNKPNNWAEIEEDCVKALEAVGLDIGSCDVRVKTSANDDGSHDFAIIEINSASSLSDDPENSIVAEKYFEQIPKTLRRIYDREQKKRS